MSDEIMRILKLLEDGKINSEEAERLIGAMNEKGPRGFYVPVPPKMPKEFLDKMENIPEQIGRAVSTAFGAMGANGGKRIFRGMKKIEIKVVSGDIEIVPSEEDITIDGSAWPMKSNIEDETLLIKCVNGDFTAELPNDLEGRISLVSADLSARDLRGNIQLQDISGDIELDSCSGEWDIRSVSGDVEGRGLTGRFGIKTKSADVDLDISDEGKFDIETISGDIEITIPEGSKVSINVASEKGEVNIPENLEGDVEPEKADIVISARSERGDIIISTK